MPTVSCTPPVHRTHLSVAVLWFVPLSLMAGAVHCEILVEGEDPSPPSQGFPGGGPVMKAELVPLVAEKAGLTGYLFHYADRFNLQDTGIFTVVTAVLSNVVSNVPAVMLLKPLAPAFHDAQNGWLVLAMASTLAGNLTITGSVANLIVVERAHDEAHIGFWDYSRVGIPVTLATLAVGWAWLTWVR